MTSIWAAELGPLSPDFCIGRCNLSLFWSQVIFFKVQELCPMSHIPAKPREFSWAGSGETLRPPGRINFCNAGAGLDVPGCQEGAESCVV